MLNMLKRLLLLLGLLFCSVSAVAEPVIYRVGIKENLEFLEKGRSERMDLYYPADPSKIKFTPPNGGGVNLSGNYAGKVARAAIRVSGSLVVKLSAPLATWLKNSSAVSTGQTSTLALTE